MSSDLFALLLGSRFSDSFLCYLLFTAMTMR